MAWPAGCDRPEHTLLYRIVAQHSPVFVELLAGKGRPLPDDVQREFEAHLRYGRRALAATHVDGAVPRHPGIPAIVGHDVPGHLIVDTSVSLPNTP